MINIKINKEKLSEIIYTDKDALINITDKEINKTIKEKINILQKLYEEWDQIENYKDFEKLFKEIDIYQIGDLINLLNELYFITKKDETESYKYNLITAKGMNLDPYKIHIADEVTFALNGLQINLSDENYEKACELVNIAYLKYDIEVNKIANSVTDLLYKKISIDEIDRYIIVKNIKW